MLVWQMQQIRKCKTRGGNWESNNMVASLNPYTILIRVYLVISDNFHLQQKRFLNMSQTYLAYCSYQAKTQSLCGSVYTHKVGWYIMQHVSVDLCDCLQREDTLIVGDINTYIYCTHMERNDYIMETITKNDPEELMRHFWS